jgi:inhibitor of cysteine peptidase
MAEIELTEDDDGRTIKLRPGDVIVLRLAEVAGAGYSWQPQGSGEGVLTQTASSVLSASELGGASQRVLRFEAAGPGRAAVELAYRRPWETPSAAERRFRLQVEVEAASA